jgi:hypothetical protein
MMIGMLPTLSETSRISLSRRLVFLFALGVLGVSSVFGQQHLSKRYVVGKNVRVELKNISGTITVESWNRDEVKVSANMESAKANVAPRQTGDGLIIDVIADNPGRSDVVVNFKIQVPINSSVDLETKMGQISVTNIHGRLVRAHVSSDGDIELNGITASQVFAQNLSGNIFFDGEFSRGGTYQFQSGKGEITIRIPSDSAFSLTAATPTRKIALGPFWNDGFKNLGDGRKFVGDVGDGRSSVMVTTFQGSITFIRK